MKTLKQLIDDNIKKLRQNGFTIHIIKLSIKELLQFKQEILQDNPFVDAVSNNHYMGIFITDKYAIAPMGKTVEESGFYCSFLFIDYGFAEIQTKYFTFKNLDQFKLLEELKQ